MVAGDPDSSRGSRSAKRPVPLDRLLRQPPFRRTKSSGSRQGEVFVHRNVAANVHQLGVPIVYFVGTRPNWYRPIYPTYVERDEPVELRVLLTFGKMRVPYDEREPVDILDVIERARRPRGQATDPPGAVPRRGSSRVPRTAARSVGCVRFGYSTPHTSSVTPRRPASQSSSNGLNFCSITTDVRRGSRRSRRISRVHVSHRLLDDDDGPMLDVLKALRISIERPRDGSGAPDTDRLELRFDAVPSWIGESAAVSRTGALETPSSRRDRPTRARFDARLTLP